MIPSKLPIRLVLADDHEIFRDGFRALLRKYPEIELAGEAENGKELIEVVGKLKPDVVLTDIKMPVMDGIEATKQLTQLYPTLGVIALSMFDEDHLIIDMIEAGAKGYLLKNSSKYDIVEAIQSVYRDQPYYCRSTSTKLAALVAKSKLEQRSAQGKVQFSEREIEIIHYVCEQYTNKEIAGKMKLSLRTIEGHRERIQQKMDAKNTAGVVVYAIRHGIYPLK